MMNKKMNRFRGCDLTKSGQPVVKGCETDNWI
jgi:hypothetical protein